METNNPQQRTSPQTTKGGVEGSSRLESRIEKGTERVEKAAEQLASSAVDRVREARQQAEHGIAQQRDMAAERIRRLGDVLREGGGTLGANDPLAQNLLEMTSERIERLADYVAEVTPGTLADDLQSFARRRPGLFFGGAFLIGLSIGRFVKSSPTAGARGGRGPHDAERGHGAKS